MLASSWLAGSSACLPRNLLQKISVLSEEPFEGLSTNSEVVFAGEVRDARNSKEMRIALLCEMVCRASKLLLRFYLRRSARLHGCVVPSIAAPFAIDLLNALTGGHPTADVIWQEEIVPRVNQSYGDRAIDSVEACTVRTTLLPTLPYLIRRVSALCGLPINSKALEAFDAATRRVRICGGRPEQVGYIYL